jgi:LysM repeat protein
MRRTQSSVVMLIIAMAIILAAGVFLVYSALQNRPASPEEAVEQVVSDQGNAPFVTVADQPIVLQIDPGQRVEIVNPAPAADQSPRPDEAAQDTQEGNEQSEQDQSAEGAEGGNEGSSEAQEGENVENTETQSEEPPPPPDPIIFQGYIVEANETLYSITTKRNTSIALMAQHNIAQDDLVVGQEITIPVANPAYCPQENRRPYVVKEGDTAFSIGRRFNSSAQEIRDINGLDENFTVFSATVLCVPNQ